MNNPYLLMGLRYGPEAIRNVINTIPETKWDTLTDTGRFTLREAIAHLADWEVILRERIEQTVATPGVNITGMDETERARDMKYRETNPREQADKFVAERRATIELVKTLTGTDFRKECQHNEKGTMTVADQVSMLLGHDIYHLEHLTHYFSIE
ncbi:DinB family protein [Kamptonema cortianum]|nr:DinB family protein [Geitlerinema splendidum]MDK3156179.1 DinB family protein [Kamptonema cortianum]